MVQIITDSAADFEPWELEKFGIACIPLTVTFGSRSYQENVDLSKDQFYRLLAQGEHFPVTAQASPQVLLDLFAQAKANGGEAIYITLSSALSGTYQTALVTQSIVDCDRCHVLDGRTATGGQRMLVEYAVRLRDEGKTAPEIMELVGALRERIVLYACMDTLENLYKGGRISHTVYSIGSMAQIKPILHVEPDGSLSVPGKAIGARKGMDTLCRQMAKRQPSPEHPLYVMYTDDRSMAQALAQRLEEQGYDIPDEHIIQVGAAIGTHIGSKACGFVYVGE